MSKLIRKNLFYYMKNQIQIASEGKHSNLASTLAHETRKNNAGRILFLSLCVVVAIAGAAIITSCNGDDEIDHENGSQNGNGNGNETSNVDVYVVGMARNRQALLDPDVATLWKNGVIQYLSEHRNTTARSVFVSGSDVYVAGTGLLKNGVEQNLTYYDNSFSTYSVFVSGSDVYVAGNEGRWIQHVGHILNAAVWKNGELQHLTDINDFGIAYANSVFVSGSDVYVTGNVGGVGTLWKNGVEQNLSQTNHDDYDYYSLSANSVFVSGNDVYVAGSEGWWNEEDWNTGVANGAARLWKNGIVQSLSQTNHDDYDYYTASANSVYVSGSDVYVAGFEHLYNEHEEGISFATLWKNGVVQHLSGGTGANSVFVLDDDVYVGGGGIVDSGNFGGILWINGVGQNLSNAREVNSVFVVPK